MARPSHADAQSSEVHFWLRLLLGEKRELVSVPVTGVEGGGGGVPAKDKPPGGHCRVARVMNMDKARIMLSFLFHLSEVTPVECILGFFGRNNVRVKRVS